MNPDQPSQEQARQAYIEKLVSELEALDRQAHKAAEVDQVLTQSRVKLEEQVRRLAQQLAQLQHHQAELLAKQTDIATRQQSFSQERLILDAKRKSLRCEIDQMRGRSKPVVLKTPTPQQQMRGRASHARANPEQRRCGRLVIAVTVNLQSENNFFMGLTENLSEGGLFVASYKLERVGTEVDLVINLPAESPIRTPARVQWLRENVNLPEGVSPGMGLQFLSLSEQDRNAILTFIRQRDPMFFDC